MITIELNGVPHTIPGSRDLEALIASLDLAGKGVAVPVNRQVIPRQQWSQRTLQAQDRVDVVRAIGGG